MVQNIHLFLLFQTAFEMKKEEKLIASRELYRDLYNRHTKSLHSTGE